MVMPPWPIATVLVGSADRMGEGNEAPMRRMNELKPHCTTGMRIDLAFVGALATFEAPLSLANTGALLRLVRPLGFTSVWVG